jgi:hypothetical protein
LIDFLDLDQKIYLIPIPIPISIPIPIQIPIPIPIPNLGRPNLASPKIWYWYLGSLSVPLSSSSQMEKYYGI